MKVCEHWHSNDESIGRLIVNEVMEHDGQVHVHFGGHWKKY